MKILPGSRTRATCARYLVACAVACAAPALFAQAAPPAVPPAASAVPSAVSSAEVGTRQAGKIAWYGQKFAGRRTASGETFDPEAMTMAHKTLPFGTKVRVTNPKNQKSVTLRVNDRGPTQPDRIGDVSLAAARKLGMVRSGVIEAELEVVAVAPARKGKR